MRALIQGAEVSTDTTPAVIPVLSPLCILKLCNGAATVSAYFVSARARAADLNTGGPRYLLDGPPKAIVTSLGETPGVSLLCRIPSIVSVVPSCSLLLAPCFC